MPIKMGSISFHASTVHSAEYINYHFSHIKIRETQMDKYFIRLVFDAKNDVVSTSNGLELSKEGTFAKFLSYLLNNIGGSHFLFFDISREIDVITRDGKIECSHNICISFSELAQFSHITKIVSSAYKKFNLDCEDTIKESIFNVLFSNLNKTMQKKIALKEVEVSSAGITFLMIDSYNKIIIKKAKSDAISTKIDSTKPIKMGSISFYTTAVHSAESFLKHFSPDAFLKYSEENTCIICLVLDAKNDVVVNNGKGKLSMGDMNPEGTFSRFYDYLSDKIGTCNICVLPLFNKDQISCNAKTTVSDNVLILFSSISQFSDISKVISSSFDAFELDCTGEQKEEIFNSLLHQFYEIMPRLKEHSVTVDSTGIIFSTLDTLIEEQTPQKQKTSSKSTKEKGKKSLLEEEKPILAASSVAVETETVVLKKKEPLLMNTQKETVVNTEEKVCRIDNKDSKQSTLTTSVSEVKLLQESKLCAEQ